MSHIPVYSVLHTGFKNPHEAEVVALPGGVVRVAWPKSKAFQYAGGQFVFLCIPALSIWAWHPFSISSHPEHETVYLHIRVLGDWTRRLHSLAGKQVGFAFLLKPSCH